MRDERGRYLSVKPIEDNGPTWARGCPSCTCGIVAAPELTGAASLYLERLVQAIDGDITFCTCQAGKSYRVSLLNRRQEIIEQTRRDAKTTAIVGTSNPIDIARAAIQTVQAQRVPTMRLEPTP